MARYRFTFSEEQYGYMYFDADSQVEAESLLEQIQNYDIDPEQLPNFFVKHKHGSCEYDSLEDVTNA